MSEFPREPLPDESQEPMSPEDDVIDDDLVYDDVTTPEDFEPDDPDIEAIVDEDPDVQR